LVPWGFLFPWEIGVWLRGCALVGSGAVVLLCLDRWSHRGSLEGSSSPDSSPLERIWDPLAATKR